VTLLDDALALTAEWCAIPSHAENADALSRQADAICRWLVAELGAEIITPRAGHSELAPVIHARLNIGAPKTILLYNMYDVMPATADGWRHDPWTGGISDLPGIGTAFLARGAENNKGPLAGMLMSLRQLQRAGRLAVNVEILIDGQEERGSPKMRAYLEHAACPVRPCIGGLFPSFCEYGGGPPRLYLGFSGMAKGEIVARSGGWGGPAVAIHSSNAPWIANPARVLVDALAQMGAAVTGQLGQIALDPDALALIDRLSQDFDPAAELRFRHTHRFARPADDDAGALLRHVLSTASLNLASLTTDPVAGDAIIPTAATASFDLRAPPGLSPSDMLAQLQKTIDADPLLTGTELNVRDSYCGARFAKDSVGVQALHRAYAAGPQPQIWPWAIGAAPAYAFARHAQSFLIGGAGRGGNAHGTDEFLVIEGFGRFITSVSDWIEGMAE
jgi:acetylornithine deacetylase/succinyl-diaminopimelate desuccinylase-like protein